MDAEGLYNTSQSSWYYAKDEERIHKYQIDMIDLMDIHYHKLRSCWDLIGYLHIGPCILFALFYIDNYIHDYD